jgi:hypothetical protein
MSSDGYIGFTKNGEAEVSVLMKSGEIKNLPVGGFLHASNIHGLKRLKILNIKALCDDIEANHVTYPIPKNHFVVGSYVYGSVCILVFDGSPQHHKRNDADEDYTNNVFSL